MPTSDSNADSNSDEAATRVPYLDQQDPQWALLDAAQERQLDVLQTRESEGESVGGWKLGLTSGASRDAFGVGFRPFGFVLASRVWRSGRTLWWDEGVTAGSIENEVCFEIGETITEQVTPQSVRETIRGVAPAFEINQVRISGDASNEERLIDNLSNWGIVVGDLLPLPTDWLPQALKVSLLHNADGVESVAAAGHIDDHFVSIARLSNRLLRFGRRLEAGQKVITGAFARAREPKHGLWTGDFGALGRVHVRVER